MHTKHTHTHTLIKFCVNVVVMCFILSRGNKTLTKKEKRTMAEYNGYIQDIIKTKKVRFLFCAIKDSTEVKAATIS